MQYKIFRVQVWKPLQILQEKPLQRLAMAESMLRIMLIKLAIINGFCLLKHEFN